MMGFPPYNPLSVYSGVVIPKSKAFKDFLIFKDYGKPFFLKDGTYDFVIYLKRKLISNAIPQKGLSAKEVQELEEAVKWGLPSFIYFGNERSNFIEIPLYFLLESKSLGFSLNNIGQIKDVLREIELLYETRGRNKKFEGYVAERNRRIVAKYKELKMKGQTFKWRESIKAYLVESMSKLGLDDEAQNKLEKLSLKTIERAVKMDMK